jgi:hypothetical protein
MDARMKIIKLTKGYETMVDDDDYDELNKHSWQAVELHKNDRPTTKVYAISYNLYYNNKTYYMHRIVINAPKGKQVYHIDSNSLNNQKNNLKLATTQEISFGIKKTNKKTTSIYKGVYWNKKDNVWYATIMKDRKHIHLGSFDNEHDAAIAYNNAAIEIFGEFARLNFPEDGKNEQEVEALRYE